MAMADRRPLGVPLASAHASPTVNTDGLDSPQRTSISKTPFLEKAGPSFSSDGSVSPTQMSPNSRSISPDSLMNSGSVAQKKGVSSNSSRGSTPGEGVHENGEVKKTNTGGAGFYEKAGLGSSSNFGKKPKPVSRAPIATGISTTIPVTGEKPKPAQDGDASLEDDVLYAIFLILYEKDTAGAGMTVKQICDVLIERHPEMAQLSSKTSNLVSAKLNAYVKRVEKGDPNLKYALSREWADASPKRMVYVYRGLLAKDFHVHVKSVMEKQGSVSPRASPAASNSGASPSFSTDSFEAAKQSALSKPRRQTMFDLGISRHAFGVDSSDASALFVPYSSAPVAANMAKSHASNTGEKSSANASGAANSANSASANSANSGSAAASASANSANSTIAKTSKKSDSQLSDTEDVPSPTSGAEPASGISGAGKRFFNDSDFDFDDLEVFNESEEDDDLGGFSLDIMRKAGKRSKSMSHLTINKKAKFVTAAAAAPRVPRTPCSHSPHAAAAAAALHAAALKAIAAATTSGSASENSRSTATSANENGPKWASAPKSNWAHAVKSGFLTQEIGAPEDVSLSDLDKLFG